MIARFSRSFSAAHRVWNDPGKCSNIHGHNYRTLIEVDGGDSLGAQNFVLPFDAVKGIVDRFDHTLIVDDDDPKLEAFEALGVSLAMTNGVPSTEFLALVIANGILEACIAQGIKDSYYHVVVTLVETESIQAFAEVWSPS